MKKINIIAAAMALVLSASCNRNIEFQHETFATFDAVTFSVDETVGRVSVPVSIYNPTGSEIQVTVKAVDGKGVSGVDYEIVSPASGILTFSGDVTSQNIEVEITDFSGEFTGSKDFSIEIASATAGVSVGNLNTARFTIKDLDHPLAAFIGDWTGAPLVDFFYGDQYTLNLTIIANDDDPTFSSVYVQNIDPYFASAGFNAANGCNTFLAVANAERTQLTLESGQPIGYKTCQLLGFDGPDLNTAGTTQYMLFDLNADGTLTIPNAYGVYNAGEGWYSAYLGGLTLSKN